MGRENRMCNKNLAMIAVRLQGLRQAEKKAKIADNVRQWQDWWRQSRMKMAEGMRKCGDWVKMKQDGAEGQNWPRVDLKEC